MKTPHQNKTISIPEDVIRAVDLFVAVRKASGGKGAKNFSEAVTDGLRKYLNHNGTSVPKMLGQANEGDSK